MEFILSYDIITSGLKASLYTLEGALVAAHTVPLQMHFLGNHAQQSALCWWEALKTATGMVLKGQNPKSIKCLSFTDQVQVCLPVNEKGEPLYDAITWSDTRSAEIPDPFAGMDMARYMGITGQRNTPNSSIRKLCWLKEKMPDVYKNTYKMLGCKEYLAFRLTGGFFTDYSDASSTGAFDIRSFVWSSELLQLCGVDPSLMPEAVAPIQHIGNVSKTAGAETGLSTHTAVIMGSGDFTCSALGAGCVKPGDTYFNLGSSSWIATVSSEPVLHPDMSIINSVHAVSGLYLPLASIQEAGACFKWLKGITGLGDGQKTAANPYENLYPYHGVEAHLERSNPGCGGLTFYPFLLGSTAAYYRDSMRGAFMGLGIGHTESDMTRAVWEGLCLYIARFLDSFPAGERTLLATGVASHESAMVQTLADACGRAIANTELTITLDAIGAAILAGYGAGVYDTLDMAGQFYERERVFEPLHAAEYAIQKQIFEKGFGFLKA